jgi:hypothetical protein
LTSILDILYCTRVEMSQLLSVPGQNSASLEASKVLIDDITTSSNSSSREESGKALLWRQQDRHNLSSTSIGKRKAYRNRILLTAGIIFVLGIVAVMYVNSDTLIRHTKSIANHNSIASGSPLS